MKPGPPPTASERLAAEGCDGIADIFKLRRKGDEDGKREKRAPYGAMRARKKLQLNEDAFSSTPVTCYRRLLRGFVLRGSS